MIIWNCNFNIPDSTVQLATGFIHVVSYENINSTAMANIKITDDTGNIIVKEYQKTFNKTFENIKEVYNELLLDFTDAELTDP